MIREGAVPPCPNCKKRRKTPWVLDPRKKKLIYTQEDYVCLYCERKFLKQLYPRERHPFKGLVPKYEPRTA